MTWRQNVLNTLKHLALSAGAIALGSTLAWLAGPDVAGIVSKDTTPQVAIVVVPLLHSAAVWALNQLKSRGVVAAQ